VSPAPSYSRVWVLTNVVGEMRPDTNVFGSFDGMVRAARQIVEAFPAYLPSIPATLDDLTENQVEADTVTIVYCMDPEAPASLVFEHQHVQP